MTVSGEQRSYFPWSDESAIERENAQFVNQSADLRAHTEVIAAALTFLQRMLEIQSHETDEDLVALRLGVRLLNSAAAALKLGASGFYQPAITMVRDVLELAFLMDLFRRDRKGFAEWIALSKRERKCRFSPVRVRTALDELDGFKEQKRASHYDRLSSYAAHVTPEGFAVISPDGMTRIGPYPSPKHVGAVIEELVTVLGPACLNLSNLSSPTTSA